LAWRRTGQPLQLPRVVGVPSGSSMTAAIAGADPVDHPDADAGN
jgi:hypothetical protein